MRLRKVISSVGLGSVALLFIVAAGVPADKKVITIDHLKKDKPVVEFPHAKHNEEFKKMGGAKIVCKDCHHTLKGDEPTADDKAQGCPECHVQEGQTQKKVGDKTAPFMATTKDGKWDRKSVIFHERCLDNCHKKVQKETGKKIAACKTCHKEK